MNFGTWKVKVNDKDYLEFWHKNPNNNEFEVVKTIKYPLKNKVKKMKKKQKKHKISFKINKNNKNKTNKTNKTDDKKKIN